jgi:cell division ATPase FtsA
MADSNFIASVDIGSSKIVVLLANTAGDTPPYPTSHYQRIVSAQ